MLITRSIDGHLHSRAMSPSSRPYFSLLSMTVFDNYFLQIIAHSDTQLTLYFIANNVSHKFEEIEHDTNVNVSFYNRDTTSWAS